MPITSEPPANAPPVGSAKAIWSFTFAGASWSTGMWLLLTGTPAPGDLSDLATDLYGTFQTTILPNLSSSCILEECTVHYFPEGEELTATSVASHAGSDEAEILGINSAAVLSWIISTRYRGGKPRNYLGGLSQASLDSSRSISDGLVSALTSDAADWLTAVNGLAPGSITTVSAGTVHFFSGGVALDPSTFDPYIGVSAQKRLCSQRRRTGREF